MLLNNLKQTHLAVAGLRIHCMIAGKSGPPLILLHGGGVDSAKLSWGASIGPLAATHQVFAPDLPGYGQSDKPDVAYTMDYYVNFLRHLLHVLHLEKVRFIGLSLGGGIALGLALRFPEKVEKLVLVSPYGIMKKYPYHKLSYLYVHTPINELSYWFLRRSRSRVRQSLLSGAFHNTQRLSQDLADEVYQAMQDPHAGKAFASFQRSEFQWNGVHTHFTDQLHEITAPTLIINGSEDKLVTVDAAQNATKQIKHAKIHILPECAHWSQREKPEEFNHVVLKFLDG